MINMSSANFMVCVDYFIVHIFLFCSDVHFECKKVLDI
jgi:hypothetical protein